MTSFEYCAMRSGVIWDPDDSSRRSLIKSFISPYCRWPLPSRSYVANTCQGNQFCKNRETWNITWIGISFEKIQKITFILLGISKWVNDQLIKYSSWNVYRKFQKVIQPPLSPVQPSISLTWSNSEVVRITPPSRISLSVLPRRGICIMLLTLDQRQIYVF